MNIKKLNKFVDVLKDIQELINSGLYNVDDIADELLESGAIDNDPELFDITIDEIIETLKAVGNLKREKK